MTKLKQSLIQTILTTLYVVCLLISNIIATKQVQFPFGIIMTGAVVIFPVTYILSDVFSEVYGYKWSRISCYIGFCANLLMSLVFQLVIILKAPDYWTNQEAFVCVLGNTPRILIASLLGYFGGDLVNDLIFQEMKKRQGEKGFKSRALLSSFFGELTDSGIFVPLAFYGTMPMNTLFLMIIVQPLLKVLYETIICPLTALICKKLKAYETC